MVPLKESIIKLKSSNELPLDIAVSITGSPAMRSMFPPLVGQLNQEFLSLKI